MNLELDSKEIQLWNTIDPGLRSFKGEKVAMFTTHLIYGVFEDCIPYLNYREKGLPCTCLGLRLDTKSQFLKLFYAAYECPVGHTSPNHFRKMIVAL